MNKAVRLAGCCFLLISLSALFPLQLKPASAAPVRVPTTLILYDAASGAVPGAPLMTFTDFPPGTALQTYANGATVLDTTAAGSETYAGWVSGGATISGFPALDRTDGFQLDFTVQVENESHTNPNRAGFSVILLGEDARGIELGFWQNEIWAQSDEATGGLFKHGEGVAFTTTGELTQYRLSIQGDTYTLTAGANPILTGPLRDYSAFAGLPDPYEMPSFLFLGDDTTSAQARVQVGFLSITGTQPILPTGTSPTVSTGSPVPTASSTEMAVASPVPSPTPPGKAFSLCPSGWILLSMILSGAMIAKKTRAG